MGEWQPIETAPLNEVVETIILDGSGMRNEQRMIQRVRGPGCRPMWWFEGCDMYAYYTPTHWRPARRQSSEDGR